MLFHTDGKHLKPRPRMLRVWVFTLLLITFCRGQSQLIGSSIVATLGKDVVLPCHLEPAEDAADLTLEWTRPDLNPRFVHVWRFGQELASKKHKSFEGRTSLFVDELMFGNISLKLSRVKLTDRGRYRCFIPALDKQSFVQLHVGAVSSPVIRLAGTDRDKGGAVLQCESGGWYPEPEVSWLDAEGNLLSAGPTETVRGPDLYTVSSRVTVEKRPSNRFTCRVQQKITNQTRETEILISDDFFDHLSGSSSTITGLAVSLAVLVILFVLLLLFSVWNWRQNIIKTKRSTTSEAISREEKNTTEIISEDERKPLKGKGENERKPVSRNRKLLLVKGIKNKIR
ncbi:butyrophilin subfamily 3 member A2-like [Etheostoma spectabile]|uniref:butyrophilin subfamily 3 member A2-like n=1 Tax=Etheostoma spectabile TaxID=54343 RepID=UPI0013AF8109|nr:butyrophilin subfamily 3 member A2-like [Etheostoma spectabile]